MMQHGIKFLTLAILVSKVISILISFLFIFQKILFSDSMLLCSASNK